MGILKPMMYDSYAYQMGEFPIAAADQDKVKAGMFCKLNTNKEICVAGAGEKGFMVLFPKKTGRQGFAILHGAFYIGSFTLSIDDECFDKTKTYVAGQPLFVNADGLLTNDKAVSVNPVPVASVLRPARVINEKTTIAITSYSGLPAVEADSTPEA